MFHNIRMKKLTDNSTEQQSFFTHLVNMLLGRNKDEKYIKLKSINRTIVAEYFTPDWFGTNDIINYQTDHVRMKDLSLEDLKLVENTLL